MKKILLSMHIKFDEGSQSRPIQPCITHSSCTQREGLELIAEYLRGNGVHLVHCLKVASKLFYSSLHAGYFAFFVVVMCFYSYHCSFQKHQSVKKLSRLCLGSDRSDHISS